MEAYLLRCQTTPCSCVCGHQKTNGAPSLTPVRETKALATPMVSELRRTPLSKNKRYHTNPEKEGDRCDYNYQAAEDKQKI